MKTAPFYKGLAGLLIVVPGVLLLLGGIAAVVVPPFLDRVYYEGMADDHFDGAHFFNPEGATYQGAPVARDRRPSLFSRVLARGDWPSDVPITPAVPARLPRLAPGAMRAIWVGHSTVLIQAGGYNILTDPIWSERAGPFGLFGPARATAPGIAFEDLPRIDLVLVSHGHYDHLDLATLERLWKRDRPAIVTALGNDRIIAQSGASAQAADWGDTIAVKPGLKVHVLRVHHWMSRWLVDRDRALWAGFAIDTPAGRVLFPGDTGLGGGIWVEEAARYAPYRLALLPIGAYRFGPGQLVNDSHTGPREAAAIFRALRPAQAIPIHWGTFRLSEEGRESPPALLRLFEDCMGIDPRRFAPVSPGVVVDVAARPAAFGPPRRSAAQCRANGPMVQAFR